MMQLDLSNPQHRRALEARYFGIYGTRLSSAEITLTEGEGYHKIPAHIAAAENAKVAK